MLGSVRQARSPSLKMDGNKTKEAEKKSKNKKGKEMSSHMSG